MTKRTCATAALAIWFTGTVTAQSPGPASMGTGLSAPRPASSFEELQARVKTGDVVYVTDTSGVTTRGKIAALTDVSLTLILEGMRREFASSAVGQIERRHRDSVRDGLLIGLGSGALVGVLAGRAADSPSCPRRGIECGQGALVGAVGGAVWGGLGGWIADALIHKREVIYLAQGQPVDGRRRESAETAWPRVQQLDSHETVRVELDDRTGYQGTLRAADDNSVTLEINGDLQPLARAHIHRVSVARRTHRRRLTWIGLSIGAATAGIGVGVHCRGGNPSCTEVAPAYFYPLTAAGGVVGALLPAGQSWQTVFVRSEP